MKRLIFIFILNTSIFNPVYAEEQPTFPSTISFVSQLTGAPPPSAEESRLNPKFENEVLRKYDFYETWNTIVARTIRVELVKAYSKICGSKLGTDTEFAVAVFAHTKYDVELAAIVKKTDSIQKVQEYFIYKTLPSPEQYKQLEAIPSNDLSRQFVAKWIASEYLERSHNTIIEIAERFLRTKCDS